MNLTALPYKLIAQGVAIALALSYVWYLRSSIDNLEKDIQVLEASIFIQATNQIELTNTIDKQNKSILNQVIRHKELKNKWEEIINKTPREILNTEYILLYKDIDINEIKKDNCEELKKIKENTYVVDWN